MEVTLDVSLFERLDLAGKDVFDPEVDPVLRFNGTTYHLEGKQRRLGS